MAEARVSIGADNAAAETSSARRNGRVGTRLVSETDTVRVWHIVLSPGERLPAHCHVLDYFWTATAPGRARSHTPDGRVVEVSYAEGETKHLTFGPGEFMIHDLENVGDTTLRFTTVEFKKSANKPLEI